MSDGAHLGVTAGRALDTVIGGEPSPKPDKTPRQMRDAICAQSFVDLDYSGAALACARLIFEAYEAHPSLRDHPTETVYLCGPEGKLVHGGEGLVTLQPGLYDVIKSLNAGQQERLDVLSGLTGFMWGWACNAVRYALHLPSVRNPALVTLNV